MRDADTSATQCFDLYFYDLVIVYCDDEKDKKMKYYDGAFKYPTRQFSPIHLTSIGKFQ